MALPSSNAAAGVGRMSALDLELCRAAVASLTSSEHSKKNYLFLQPVDLQLHPTYLSVVKRPMDLGTLSRNLEAGMYPNREAFFGDAMLCFQNALRFHKGNKETQWIIGLAKEMMKLVTKEMRAAEKKAKDKGQGTKKQTKKLKAKKGDNGQPTTKKQKSDKPGLKLKLSTGSRGKEAPAAALAASGTQTSPGTTKPKIKLKGPSACSDSASSKGKEASQPKLKLKLSLSKKKSTGSSEGSSKKVTLSAPSRGKVPPAAAVQSGSPKPDAAPAPAPAPSKPPSTKPAPNKIQVRLSAPSRGKELPKGVAAPAPAKPEQKKKSSPKKSSGTKKSPSTKHAASGVPFAMNSKRKAQCMKVLSGLKRRQSKNAKWFSHPISDKLIIDDYKAKIPSPMDLGTMATKLEKNQYATVTDFVLDLRRIFANCVRYNTTSRDEFRGIGIEMLSVAEELMAHFIAKNEQPAVVYSPLLYSWKTCVMILDALLNVKNPSDGHQTAHYFLHPVAFYFGGNLPPDYLTKVKCPMDLGTVTSLLLEGVTQSVSEFADNCLLVMKNCLSYYEGTEGGAVFTEQASRLKALMMQQLEALKRYDQSPAGMQARNAAVTWKTVKLPRPNPSFLLGILGDLRALKYTDRSTRITEDAMAPFERPVNLSLYPDYPKYVETPIDLQTIEQKVKSGFYETPEDFEYDVALVFRNCEEYNQPRKSDHIVAMGKYGAKMFRKIFSLKMKSLENPEPKQPPKDAGVREERKDQKRSLSPTAQQRPSKKVKIETGANSVGKAAPRISIQGGMSAGKGQRSKSPKTAGGPKKKVTESAKSKGPVPLHVAIAQVKERFPLRRQYKFLEKWEESCARFFKELMRHPWISAARPTFIFHVPVPVLFPDLEEAYISKIEKPMDLTTAEAKLLQGNIYRSPQDFVDEVALVFANAITFNRAGHELGDPFSCAYYDASVHLLRYTRWLSLELLTPYLSDDPVADDLPPGHPPTSWKLSHINKKKVREEMESIVLNEPIEKSIEGDKFTWMESECEKLLKALRHQSDLKYMTFFIQPNYPADYAAFISTPMDWERVQRTLVKREYDTFGEVIEDLRLIFTNALKYNARAKGTETVSGRAYDSAIFMSKKLETAIDKMILTVSDRIERERIDHVAAEREIEARERVERERVRERLRNAGENRGQGDSQTGVEMIETVRVMNKRPAQRRAVLDFDFPYFEEDDGHHEQSHVDTQKGMFERQRRSRNEMYKTTMSAGSMVFQRLALRKQAIERAKKIAAFRRKANAAKEKVAETQKADKEAASETSATSVLSKERTQISIRLKSAKPKKKRKNPPPLAFD